MHPNRRRGEVIATLDGRPYRLRLTLGALAEMEAAFAAQDLTGLAERFAGGRLSARDIGRIVAAGLRGAGESVTDEAVLAMHHEDGLAGCAGIVAELLTATFGAGPAEQPANP